MAETLVKVEHVGKKFCSSLKRSLWYGLKDLGSELTGRGNGNVRKLRAGEFWAVKDVSLELRRGDTLGLIGRNGAGKTTLLRMLNGLIKPDKGSIEIRGRMQALIALGAGFNPVLTGRENIYINAAVLGIRRSDVDKKFKDIVEFSGVADFIDMPVQSYSSGMAVRLGFAVAVHMDPDILLVDEVLAVGDLGFQSKCLNRIGELKRNGTAIILVSHNMNVISNFAQNLAVLDKGKAEFFKSVPAGIDLYYKLSTDGEASEIEKLCTGNKRIRFSDIKFGSTTIRPGDSFSISMKYESAIDYEDVEVGTAVLASNVPGLSFHATNKAFNKNLSLRKGDHEIRITIQDLRINNARGTIAIAIWAKNRSEQLFWWRIPVQFAMVDYSTGHNFFRVSYE